MKEKKIVFMGTPEFSVPVLSSLVKNYQVIAIVTQPDKRVGRKKEIKFSPVKEYGLKNNIPVLQPTNIKTDYQSIIDLSPDIIITCAYGQIISKELLSYPEFGCINVHASLLPKLRGGAPIHKAIIEGHNKTGITIMYMDEKMDTGDIISQEEVIIEESDNVGILHDKLSSVGSSLLIKTLPDIFKKNNKRVKQDSSIASYAFNVKREEELINFNKSVKNVYNQIRGLNPWPLAYMQLDGEEIKVLESYYEQVEHNKKISTICDIRKDSLGIACTDGILYITKIKRSGKKEMLISDYLRGVKISLIGKVVNNGK